jgi:hypothetical protein
MLIIIEVATGVILGGLFLYWLLSPEKVAKRRDRRLAAEFGRAVHLEAEKQKAMSPEEREKYLQQKSE